MFHSLLDFIQYYLRRLRNVQMGELLRDDLKIELFIYKMIIYKICFFQIILMEGDK